MDDIKTQPQKRQRLEDDEVPTRPSPKKKRNTKTLISRLVVGLVVLGALGFGISQYLELQDIKKNPDALSQEQVDSLTDKVSKLISVPSDEQPTIATVQDKEKLKEQPFFAEAENGDKLLIYTKAQKAIIYRENGNKLINVGPVTMDLPADQATGTPEGIEQNTEPDSAE